MLHFLTAALADRNPAAYTAHFRRLSAAEQSAYLAGLDPKGLATHLRATGTPVTLGFILTVHGDSATLGAMVAGQARPKAEGWAQAREALNHARVLALGVGSPVVTGLLEIGLAELVRPGLPADLLALGWAIREVLVWVDTERHLTEWNVSGTLDGGTFWSRRQRLQGGRELLDQAATQLGARLEVSEV